MQYFSIVTRAAVYSRQINNQQKNIHKQGGKENVKGVKEKQKESKVTPILHKFYSKVLQRLHSKLHKGLNKSYTMLNGSYTNVIQMLH